MKKIIESIVVIFTAAVLFCGCTSPDSGKPSNNEGGSQQEVPHIRAEVPFPNTDTTKDFSNGNFELKDGNYTYAIVMTSETDDIITSTITQVIDFTVADDKVNYTSNIQSNVYPLPKNATQEKKDELISKGCWIDEEEGTYIKTQEFEKKEMTKNDALKKLLYFLTKNNVKTNEDNTKYYKYEFDRYNGTQNSTAYYLLKR